MMDMTGNRITVAMVEQEIIALREIAKTGDDEAAHSLEDELWCNVLQAIAERRCEFPASLAAACLKTRYLDFARHCG